MNPRTLTAVLLWPWRTTLCLLDLCDCGGLVGYGTVPAPVHEP